MKIYFIASSRLVDIDPKLYEKIYNFLAKDGKMVSDKVMQWIKKGVADIQDAPKKQKIDNYKTSMDCVKKSDLVVMEVSGHSMSMGYLVSKALEISKPVIAIYKKGHVPIFLSGIEDPKLKIVEYENGNVLEVLEGALNKAKSLIDVRFNFFVSPSILAYLDWVSRRRMIPRSVFLRDLIEKELKKDKEYKV